MSTYPIPTHIQASDISSGLNSVIFFIFLMGMYTAIYFGTIYVYYTKNPSKYHPVPAAITMLYLGSMAQAAFQWYATKWEFVDNGSTRLSVFMALTYFTPPWLNIAANASFCIVFVIADGLLIWRCFHVWNGAMRMISLPLLLIITETALYLVELSLKAKYLGVHISVALAATIDDVLAAAYFMSFGTTLVTTTLIAYRIYSVSNQEGASSRRFKHVIDIVVQSGAVYALSQLVAGVASVSSDDPSNARSIAFQDYAVLLNVAVAGISTTIMVARVALLSEETTYPSTSVHLSGLQFHARSTHPTVDVEAIEVTHSVDNDRSSAGEEHAVDAKVQ